MKPAIPAAKGVDPYLFLVLDALKTNVESVTGVRGGVLSPLPVSATNEQIIAKINEIIARLNYR